MKRDLRDGIRESVQLEVDILKRPFKEGETLWSYAKRIVEVERPGYVIWGIDTRMTVLKMETQLRTYDSEGGHEHMLIDIVSKEPSGE